MKLEVIYPELCNLYGEMANIRYLQKSLPGSELVETHLGQIPACLRGEAVFAYMGAMTERGQALALERMRPHAERYRRAIENGVVFLATGNAMELFGQSIQDGDTALPALGIFSYRAERDMENRHNSMFLGTYNEIKVVGAKSQFSHTCGEVEPALFQVTGGFGSNLKSRREGIHVRNFFGTYLLGPLLPLNPLFTRCLMKLLGSEERPACEAAAMQAYCCRVRELEQEGVNFLVGEHG